MLVSRVETGETHSLSRSRTQAEFTSATEDDWLQMWGTPKHSNILHSDMGVVTDKHTGKEYTASSMFHDEYHGNPSYFKGYVISDKAWKAIETQSNTGLWMVEKKEEEEEEEEKLLLTDSEYHNRFCP